MHASQKTIKLVVMALALMAAVSPASARRQFGADGMYHALSMNAAGRAAYLGQSAAQPQDGPTAPYAMSYSDEVAQALGLKNGPVNLLSSAGPAKGISHPALSGGIKHNGVMFKLEW